MRAELVAVTEQAVGLRGRIMLARAELRRQLTQIPGGGLDGWLEHKRLVLEHSQVSEQRIRDLAGQLRQLEELRKRKIEQVLQVRKFRKSLEKLRTKAREEFEAEQRRQWQTDVDDRTADRYARRILLSA